MIKMPAAISLKQDFPRLTRQRTSFPMAMVEQTTFKRSGTNIEILPLTRATKNVQLVRQRTMDFDIWGVVTDKSRDCIFVAPENSPVNLSRPASKQCPRDRNPKVPILGPTRQQTEVYFKKRKEKGNGLQGLNLRGPPSGHSGKSVSVNDYPLLEEKLYESALNDKSQTELKKDISNLASTSVLSRRNKLSDQQDGIHDIRFFAELVKPLQYRLRVGRKAQKVITPSKHGYHPRSQSPTFKRLIEATEKLQVFAECDTSTEKRSTPPSDANNNKSLHSSPKRPFSLKQCNNSENSASFPYSESSSIGNTTDQKSYNDMIDLRDLEIPKDFPPGSAISDEDGNESGSETTESDKSEAYFKVDFRSNESHAELHLFLPQINYSNNNNERLGTGSDKFGNRLGKDGQTKLPMISHSGQVSNSAKTYGGYKKVRKSDNYKKKKKKIERCPSAADDDHRIRDHLNDVSTLISLQKDNRHHPHHRKESTCTFDKCPYHTDEHEHNH